MKKLLIIIVLFCQTVVVKAANFNTYLNGNGYINPSGTFDVTFGASNASDLYGLNANLEYDHNLLELVSYNGLNGFNLTYGNNKIVLDSASSKSGNVAIASFRFKATANFGIDQSTTITINAIEGGNGEQIFIGNPSSFTVSVVKPKDANNKLKTLSIEGQTVSFNPNENVYYLKVDNNVKNIKISATADSNKAKVEGTGTFDIKVYDNEYQIIVTAENGVKNVYRLIVNRADEEGKYSLLNSPLLSVLVIDGYVLNFKNNKFNYSIDIDDKVEDLSIFAYPQMDEYKVIIDKPEELIIGENIIKIHVIDDKNNESIYIINAFKSETKSNECSKDKEPNTNNLKYIIVILMETCLLGVMIGYILINKNKK